MILQASLFCKAFEIEIIKMNHATLSAKKGAGAVIELHEPFSIVDVVKLANAAMLIHQQHAGYWVQQQCWISMTV